MNFIFCFLETLYSIFRTLLVIPIMLLNLLMMPPVGLFTGIFIGNFLKWNSFASASFGIFLIIIWITIVTHWDRLNMEKIFDKLFEE